MDNDCRTLSNQLEKSSRGILLNVGTNIWSSCAFCCQFSHVLETFTNAGIGTSKSCGGRICIFSARNKRQRITSKHERYDCKKPRHTTWWRSMWKSNHQKLRQTICSFGTSWKNKDIAISIILVFETKLKNKFAIAKKTLFPLMKSLNVALLFAIFRKLVLPN